MVLLKGTLQMLLNLLNGNVLMLLFVLGFSALYLSLYIIVMLTLSQLRKYGMNCLKRIINQMVV